MSIQECEDCKYFRHYENREQGLCRRYPPQGDLQTVIYMLNELKQGNEEVEDELFETSTIWWSHPCVDVNDYCGEFVEAPEDD